mgnify:CR=1 FL=1
MSFERDATVSAYLTAHKLGLPGCKTELDTYTALAKDLQRQLQTYQETTALAAREVINQMCAASQKQAYWNLQLTKEEYYYLSCILGHLVPAGKISKSLLDKVGLDELDSEDFDFIQFKGDEVGGYSITINEEKE